jgi:hypothetical protein
MINQVITLSLLPEDCIYYILTKINKPEHLMLCFNTSRRLRDTIKTMYNETACNWFIYLYTYYLTKKNKIYRSLDHNVNFSFFSRYNLDTILMQNYISCRYCKKCIPGFYFCYWCGLAWCPNCYYKIPYVNNFINRTIYGTEHSSVLIPSSYHPCWTI